MAPEVNTYRKSKVTVRDSRICNQEFDTYRYMSQHPYAAYKQMNYEVNLQRQPAGEQ